MKKILMLTLAAAVTFGHINAQKTKMDAKDNTLSVQEKKEGWKLLFDGTSNKGWHSYSEPGVNNAWQVQDGAFHLDKANQAKWPKNKSNDLLSNEEYDNFDLKVDWKIAKDGNSGIIFYVKEDMARYHNTFETGLEMQVLDNEGHPDAKIPKHRAGDLYDLISSSSEPVKPALEWNHAEIKSNNGKLDLYLNGVHVVTTTLWDENWKKMVAGSKFKSMPDFGTFKKGKIALQEHGEEVWYKNIKIRKL